MAKVYLQPLSLLPHCSLVTRDFGDDVPARNIL